MQNQIVKLIAVLVFAATCPQLQAEGTVVFAGTVVSVGADGRHAILMCEPSSSLIPLIGELKPYSAVYVMGDFSRSVDGDRFKVIGVTAGRAQYTTASGAMA